MYHCSLPEKWEELTAEQFVAVVSYLSKPQTGMPIDLTLQLVGIPDEVAVSLELADWWWLWQELKWVEEIEKCDTLVIQELKLKDGTVCYGYDDDLSNISWEEFIYADTYAAEKRYSVVAGVLYRPERAGYSHESDRRIPFSKYGADARSQEFANLGSDWLEAIGLNYLLLRRRLTKQYPRIFSEVDPEEEEQNKRMGKRKQRPRGSNWLGLIRSMMGDNFFEEQKYMSLPVPSVLFQINRVVKENNERRRHGNK